MFHHLLFLSAPLSLRSQTFIFSPSLPQDRPLASRPLLTLSHSLVSVLRLSESLPRLFKVMVSKCSLDFVSQFWKCCLGLSLRVVYRQPSIWLWICLISTFFTVAEGEWRDPSSDSIEPSAIDSDFLTNWTFCSNTQLFCELKMTQCSRT